MLMDPAISLALSLPLAALLLAGAAHKALEFGAFVRAVRDYRLAPNAAAPLIATAAVTAEIAASAGLVWPTTRAMAGFLAAGLFLAYGAAIAINLARGRKEIDCGCSFGRGGKGLSALLLWRNGALALAAAAATLPSSSRAVGLFDLLSIAFFGATLAALYLAGEAMRVNHLRFEETRR
jgi:hypothetical protein